MRRHSREIALPQRLLEVDVPRPRVRVPVRKLAKHTGLVAYRLVLAALLLLIGYGLVRRALAPSSCCGSPVALTQRGR